MCAVIVFFFSSRRRHTRFKCDWSSDVCSSDLGGICAPPTAGVVNGVGGGPGFGTLGAGNILGPSQDNWDMTIAKLIKIPAGHSLQFRAEFFNTFNQPQFPNINDMEATTYPSANHVAIRNT